MIDFGEKFDWGLLMPFYKQFFWKKSKNLQFSSINRENLTKNEEICSQK